jgi:hypothetical protein
LHSIYGSNLHSQINEIIIIGFIDMAFKSSAAIDALGNILLIGRRVFPMIKMFMLQSAIQSIKT